jgi:hypothetical protein
MKALFILKRRQDYSTNLENFNHQQVATGMFNSATFVSDMINGVGVESKVIVVVDNNCIDRAVTEYKPTHVFIEGYWVVPDKFKVLKKLHPRVKWIVRCHSEMPFLAQEGIAIDWTVQYWHRGVMVAGNSPRINNELRIMARESLGWDDDKVCEMVPMLPNYYPVADTSSWCPDVDDNTINIACFGAIRPMKNHLVQAMAAIEFAHLQKKRLNFHINRGRIELYGENSVKNLKALFEHTKHHNIVEHQWCSHHDFLNVIRTMDLCMQVSFTETFNIVTADAVSVGCPVVVSKEINWLYPIYADPTSMVDIVDKMQTIWNDRLMYASQNRQYLRMFSLNSRSVWIQFFFPNFYNY